MIMKDCYKTGLITVRLLTPHWHVCKSSPGPLILLNLSQDQEVLEQGQCAGVECEKCTQKKCE